MNDDFTMGEVWNALREQKREERMRVGIDCPGCKRARPKACPTRLMPGKRCRVCGTTYEQARKALEVKP